MNSPQVAAPRRVSGRWRASPQKRAFFRNNRGMKRTGRTSACGSESQLADHASDVGARRVHQAAPLNQGRRGLRCHPGGRRALSEEHEQRKRLEVWKPNRHVRFMQEGDNLRVQRDAAFTMHRSVDGWRTVHDSAAIRTSLNIYYVDVPQAILPTGSSIRFTFHWTDSGHWEGRDFSVAVR
jgi:hypothetical protein